MNLNFSNVNPNTSPEQVEQAKLIDRACCQFESAWQMGVRPDVDEYLRGVPESIRDDLLLELIPIDQHYRSQNREAFDPNIYFQLYPHLKARLEILFDAPPTLKNPDTGNIIISNPGQVSIQIPGYEIETKIGQGGMAEVYRARDLKLNRTVAIKMILGSQTATPEDRIRMRLEAEAIAALHHPNIVELHALHEVDNQPVLVMGFVPGGTLHAHLRAKPPSVTKAAEMLESIARGVHHAHQRGVLHRDLKPSNILLDADGTPKISDFGLAKRLDLQQALTQTGIVVGTPAYMAPEQARGEIDRVGTSVDIHALGIILYEMLTGVSPFETKSIAETLKRVREVTPPRPAISNPKVPRDLDTICLKCLRKEPEERYTSALELAQDLRRFLDGKPIQARPMGIAESLVRWTRRNPAAAILVLVLILGGSFIAFDAISGNLERIRRNQEIEIALMKLNKIEDKRNTLDDALAETTRLELLLPGLSGETRNRVEQTIAGIRRMSDDRSLVRSLEIAAWRLQAMVEKRLEHREVEELFRQAFEATGLKFDEKAIEATATRIGESRYSTEILGWLDHWTFVRGKSHGQNDPLFLRLCEIAEMADPEPEHVAVRSALHRGDHALLEQSVDSPACRNLPTVTIVLISRVLRRETNSTPPRMLEIIHRHEPWKFSVNFELGLWHLKSTNSTRYHDARRYFTACLALSSDHPEVHQLLAMIAIELQSRDEALFHIGRALAIRPHDADFHYHAGKVLQELGEHSAAIEEYRTALACEPTRHHHKAWNNLSIAYQDCGQFKLALKSAQQALEIDPKFAPARVSRGTAYLLLNDFEKAFADFQEARRFDPTMSELNTNSVNLLIRLGEFEEAITLGRLYLKAKEDPKTRLNLASALGEIGDTEGAAKQFSALARLQPDYLLAWNNLGIAQMTLGKYDEATFALEKAKAIIGNNPKRAELVETNLKEIERYQKQLTDLPDLLKGKKSPTEEQEVYDFALICLARGHAEKSTELFVKLFTIDPKNRDDGEIRFNALLAASGNASTHPQARIWMRDEFTRLKKSDWKNKPETRVLVRRRLQVLKQHLALAPLREGVLWEEIEAFRKEVREYSTITFTE